MTALATYIETRVEFDMDEFDSRLSCYSDIFKDLNGFRPRGVLAWAIATMTDEEFDTECSQMIEQANYEYEEYQAEERDRKHYPTSGDHWTFQGNSTPEQLAAHFNKKRLL
mgnify:CR=1 FL=1